MARFFELLVVESDPTRFAAMAENLPEPPPFEGLAIGIDEIMAQAAAAVAIVAPKPEVEEAPEAEAEAVAETVEAEATAGTLETEAEAVAETVDVESAAQGAMVDDGAPRTEAEREAAMSAIAAAFEAAAQAEADASRAEAAAERAESAAGEGEHGEATEDSAETETETDPRLAALSESGFDAAEAEAAAGAVSEEQEEIADIGEDALSKRLGTLVPEGVRYPERQASKSGPAATTQVVVVGLVSVASIASFKRHLGRATGVQSVGVSSGPDGEFVFAVAHGADVSLRDMIPSLPGFQARVTNSGDGVINVTARDPESEG